MARGGTPRTVGVTSANKHVYLPDGRRRTEQLQTTNKDLKKIKKIKSISLTITICTKNMELITCTVSKKEKEKKSIYIMPLYRV